jgi:hypothetical protein
LGVRIVKKRAKVKKKIISKEQASLKGDAMRFVRELNVVEITRGFDAQSFFTTIKLTGSCADLANSASVGPNGALPALIVTGASRISIRAGTRFAKRTFVKDTPVSMSRPHLEPGCDYGVVVTSKSTSIEKLSKPPKAGKYLGGFHFAPGGNAAADRGGDDKPAINPCSVWDINFRPTCHDPRGMTLVDVGAKKIWVDIYLLAKNHLADGTSRFGVTIADGNDQPDAPAGGQCAKLDYAAAAAVMKHHGKGLLSPEEFYAAASGVTERSSAKGDPRVTGLDAPRTSKFGLMQATGNLWVWGHDGTSEQRASLFGGSWLSDDDAGSRCASVACLWPDISSGDFGARGRSDHLQPD